MHVANTYLPIFQCLLFLATILQAMWKDLCHLHHSCDIRMKFKYLLKLQFWCSWLSRLCLCASLIKLTIDSLGRSGTPQLVSAEMGWTDLWQWSDLRQGNWRNFWLQTPMLPENIWWLYVFILNTALYPKVIYWGSEELSNSTLSLQGAALIGIASCSSASSHGLVNSVTSCMRVLVGNPSQVIVFFSFDHRLLPNHNLCISFPPLVKSMSQRSPCILSTTIPFPSLNLQSLTSGSCLELVVILCCPVHSIWVAHLCMCIFTEWLRRSFFPFPLVSCFCAAMKICLACVTLFLSLAQVRHLHV